VLSCYPDNRGRNLCAGNRDCTSSAGNVCFVVPPLLRRLFLITLPFLILILLFIFLVILYIIPLFLFLFPNPSSLLSRLPFSDSFPNCLIGIFFLVFLFSSSIPTPPSLYLPHILLFFSFYNTVGFINRFLLDSESCMTRPVWMSGFNLRYAKIS
jgi:hypothetical protein